MARSGLMSTSSGGRRGGDPYNIGWLGSNFPHPNPIVPSRAPIPPAFQPIQPGASRPTYDLAGVAAKLGPFFRIPFRSDFEVLLKIRESIPLIDAAMKRLLELIDHPAIEASARVKVDIDRWLQQLPVNRTQYGLPCWIWTHCGNMHQYGFGHTEVLLTNDRRDVAALVPVHPATTAFRPQLDGYALDVVQYQHGGGTPRTLAPELLLTSVNDIRGDDPNGTSLLWSLPFVSELLQKMMRAVGDCWDRFGSPSMHANWEPPDTWNDPESDQAIAIRGRVQDELYQCHLDRKNGKIRDLVTTGKWTMSILGAEGEALDFDTPCQRIEDEIMTTFGIPPFMLGISRATTERMSTAQAKVLTEIIDSARETIGSEIVRLITLRQRLRGSTEKFELAWPEVSLQDLVDTERAAWMEQQGLAIKLENLKEEARLGVISIEEMAQGLRGDMDGLTPEEVRIRLPDLVQEVPDPTPVQVAAVGNQPPAGGNSPQDEATKAFWRQEFEEIMANNHVTNGRH
jgi:hypothetical protein